MSKLEDAIERIRPFLFWSWEIRNTVSENILVYLSSKMDLEEDDDQWSIPSGQILLAVDRPMYFSRFPLVSSKDFGLGETLARTYAHFFLAGPHLDLPILAKMNLFLAMARKKSF